MTATIIKTHAISIDARRRGISAWKVPTVVKKEMLQFLNDLELGKVNRGRRISTIRQAKYLDLLKPVMEFFNRPTHRLTPKNLETFEHALSSDVIISRIKKAPYSHSTKVDMRKALKIYLRWRLGNTKAVRLAGWLDTRDRVKTPDFLKEQEIEQLVRNCRTAEQRFIVTVLFDSGARAEEFLNIRYEDVHLPEGKENFVRITLKEEYSKTKGRSISLFWRHSLSAVTEYVKERIAQGIGSQDPVFRGTYDAMRVFLRRLGIQTIKRPVHPHLFRHSSATFYATKLNRQELCYRYGWKFSSNMPDVYISRSGMENKELDLRFTNTELGNLKDELGKIEQESKIKDDRIAKMETALAKLQDYYFVIMDILERNPSMAGVEAALTRKQKTPAPGP